MERIEQGLDEVHAYISRDEPGISDRIRTVSSRLDPRRLGGAPPQGPLHLPKVRVLDLERTVASRPRRAPTRRMLLRALDRCRPLLAPRGTVSNDDCHLFVISYEELTLRHRFGPVYEEYLGAVHRWIPHPPGRG